MYLFHRPVWWIMAGLYDPEDVKIKAIYLTLLGIPLIVWSSYSLQKFYDKYFRRRFIPRIDFKNWLLPLLIF